jgi:nucleoside 2-deoxyribosyltransferase
MLMRRTDFILVNGGFASDTDTNTTAADQVVAEGALEALKDMGSDAEVQNRIETYVPETDKRARHDIGHNIPITESDTATRRIAMVHNSDAVIAFAGEKGTPAIINFAFFQTKTLILIPSFGGKTATLWDDFRDALKERLHLTDTELSVLEETPPREDALIDTCHTLLLRCLRPGCFVASRFEHLVPGVPEKIASTVGALGYEVVYLKGARYSGSAVDAVWDQIRKSALVIADLTDNSPNVYYEVGIAQALGKPTFLIIHSPDGSVPADVPFDIRNDNILTYGQLESLEMLLKEQVPNAMQYRHEHRHP